MKTIAPGKVLLSGAYSVLEAAPAIVTAIERYVIVDTQKTGTFLTEEVRAAGIATPYWFDASALRAEGRKLGIGSSAAILLASLAARELTSTPQLSTHELRERLFLPALTAHRQAQGGGSGLDVAASCFGGTLAYLRGENQPSFKTIALPDGIVVEVWSSLIESVTKGLIARVRSLSQHSPAKYRAAMDAQGRAAQDAVDACESNSASKFLAALDAQRLALTELGQFADAPIVTDEVACLAQDAAKSGAVVLPSGAGGGDIAIYVGTTSSSHLSDRIMAQRHERLDGNLDAPGVRQIDG